MNLVSDALQRTCTGTITINLEGSGWEPSEPTTTEGPGYQGKPTTSGFESGEDVGGKGDDGYSGTNGQGGTEVGPGLPLIADNVHFGPAGIGLLIMGFLVLGCKYFNSPFYMCPLKRNCEKCSDLSIKYILQILIFFNYQDISIFSAGLIRLKSPTS